MVVSLPGGGCFLPAATKTHTMEGCEVLEIAGKLARRMQEKTGDGGCYPPAATRTGRMSLGVVDRSKDTR